MFFPSADLSSPSFSPRVAVVAGEQVSCGFARGASGKGKGMKERTVRRDGTAPRRPHPSRGLGSLIS